jgi:hypothetical protein
MYCYFQRYLRYLREIETYTSYANILSRSSADQHF